MLQKLLKVERRLRFAALVVVGDRNGRVGFGTGKAQEVPEAIRKAVEDAKKNLIEVPIGWSQQFLTKFFQNLAELKYCLSQLLRVLELLPVVRFVPSSNWQV